MQRKQLSQLGRYHLAFARILSRRIFLGLLGLSALLPLSVQAQNAAQSFHNGPEQAGLVELYTSQGCSSCPPAERWLNSLKHHPNLWQRWVPLAFHVDYWNYLGWRDPWSKTEFSQRQRRHRAKGNVRSVYTPGVLVAGSEWRGHFRANKRLPEQALAAKVGELSLDIKNGRYSASYSNAATEQDYVLNIAILGMDIENRIPRGENAGRTLQQEFVVLNHQRYSAAKATTSATHHWRGTLPKLAADTAPSLAIAAWVSPGRSQQAEQALGGWLKP